MAGPGANWQFVASPTTSVPPNGEGGDCGHKLNISWRSATGQHQRARQRYAFTHSGMKLAEIGRKQSKCGARRLTPIQARSSVIATSGTAQPAFGTGSAASFS